METNCIVKEEPRMKGTYKWVFERKYSHHYSFRVEDGNGNLLWHESFHTIAQAKSAIPKTALLVLDNCPNV